MQTMTSRLEMLTVNTGNKNGDLTISFDAPSAGRFALKSIDITYSESTEYWPENLTVTRTETIPVGHPLILTASEDDTEIYYSIDDTDSWQTYAPESGIVFTQAGYYTLKYYACYRDTMNSNITTEKINVVNLYGINSALMANNDIEVTGVVVSHYDEYTLIADDENTPEDECLAVEHTAHSALQTARAGDRVTATGRATDRFGESVKAIGSISSLSINGTASPPTNIADTMVRIHSLSNSYDIQGRPATNRTRIRITPGQGKSISY